MRNARKPARALTMLFALPLGLLLCGCMHDPLPYSPHYSDITLTDPANYSFSLIKPFTRLPSTPQSRPRAGVVLAPEFRITVIALPTGL